MATLTREDRPTVWTALADATGFMGRRCVRQAMYGTAVPRAVRERALLVATELATNGFRHATNAELFSCVDGEGVHLLALDRGSGIADLSRAQQDGVSSSDSLGVGLGTIERLSSRVEWLTGAEGTVVHAVVGNPPARQWAVLDRPHPREAERGGASGDAWWVRESAHELDVVVIDAWGHGPDAAHTSRAAATSLNVHATEGPGDPAILLRTIAGSVTRQRGVVAAAASWRPSGLQAALTGNVLLVVGPLQGARTVVMGPSGVLPGRFAPRRATFDAPHAPCGILATDGLSPRRMPRDRLPKSPWLAAGVVYRAAARDADDVLVIVVREPGGQPWSCSD